MFKTLHVAKREFVATVLTKSFLIGVFILPVIITLMIPVAHLLVSNRAPAVKGTVAVIDLSGGEKGLVGDAIAQALTPASMEAQQKSQAHEESEQVGDAVEAKVGKEKADEVRKVTSMAAEAAANSEPAPEVSAELLLRTADVEVEKQKLRDGTTFDGSRLALIVVDPTAVKRASKADQFGAYQIYVKSKLDARAQRAISDLVNKAIVRMRLAANGADPDDILAMTTLPRAKPMAVTSTGDKSTGELQQFMLPVAFMMLLWISVFTSGQYLMTSTIEEKSNRIMEVLLSAVSPMQLMTGKILGQMAAGLLILCIYSGIGIASLLYFNRTELLDGGNFIFLFCFFFIAFFTIASVMAAIGSVVTDIHEAQTLMMPVMIIVMIPMFLMMPIISNPSGRMATVMSFVPPISPFVMVLRMASVSQPPPMWQLLVAVAIGIVTVFLALKGAAKVFRIGVLMYGKPPNMATLFKWMRMA